MGKMKPLARMREVQKGSKIILDLESRGKYEGGCNLSNEF